MFDLNSLNPKMTYSTLPGVVIRKLPPKLWYLLDIKKKYLSFEWMSEI